VSEKSLGGKNRGGNGGSKKGHRGKGENGGRIVNRMEVTWKRIKVPLGHENGGGGWGGGEKKRERKGHQNQGGKGTDCIFAEN